MSEKNEQIFENEEFLILLKKYETMISGTNTTFFDVEEFEQIIDYYLDEFQYDKAAEAADAARTQHPASVEIKYKLVHISLEQGDGKSALELLKDIPAWELTNAEYFYLKGTALCVTGKVHDAEKNFDKGLELAGDDIFEALLNIAIAFENARQFPLAIKYLEKAHKISPEYLSVLYDLGYFNERIDNFKKSIDYYQLYLDVDPFSESVWYNLGVAYYKLGNPDKSIEAYDFSIAINPDYASAFFNKANTYASIENYTKAIETIQEFLELEPENAQALAFLGECYEQIANYNSALKVFKKIIDLDNSDSEGWFGAGMVYYQMNNHGEAIIYILKALELEGQNQDYWINLGYIYEDSGRIQEALKCYRQVTKLDKLDHEAWNALAGLLMKNGEYYTALKYLLEASTYFDNDARINLNLAVCHFYLKDKTLARQYLESAFEAEPKTIIKFAEKYPEAKWDRATKQLVKKYKQ